MTTLPNRPHTALLVIDVQAGVVAGAHERDGVVANVARLVDRARDTEVPVVWVQHVSDELPEGSDEWQIVPELKPDDAEPLVSKQYGDAFEDTTLETTLADLGVGSLVVVGAQTDACVRSTLHGALARGYDATCQRRPHDGGPVAVGRATAGPGHRPHEHVLVVPDGPGADGRHRGDRRRRVRRVPSPTRRCADAAASTAVTFRAVIIGGDAAGMSAATRIRSARPDAEVIVLERTRFTSYSACGIPFVVGGLVAGGVDALVARSPEEHRRRGIDVRTNHDVTAIDLDAGEVEVLDQHAGTVGRLGYDELLIATGGAPGAARPARHRPPARPRRAEPHRRRDPAVARRRRLPADRDRRRRLHRPGDGRGVRRAGLHGDGRREGRRSRWPSSTPTSAPGSPTPCAATASTSAAAPRSRASSRDAVVTDDGPIDADLVILGIGVRPRSELAAAAGIELGAKDAVRVDDRQATSAAHVWSAGDCAETTHLVTGGRRTSPSARTPTATGGSPASTWPAVTPARPGVLGTAITKLCAPGDRPDRRAASTRRSTPASTRSRRRSTRRPSPATSRRRGDDDPHGRRARHRSGARRPDHRRARVGEAHRHRGHGDHRRHDGRPTSWTSTSPTPRRSPRCGTPSPSSPARPPRRCDGDRSSATRTYITDRITADGHGDWPVEPGRYRLVVARACPWANRAIIVRRLLGLEPVLSMGICGPTHDERSWTFDLDPGGRDPVLGYERLQEAFLARDPGLRPRHHRAGDRRHPHPPGRHQRLRPDHARPVDGVAGPPPRTAPRTSTRSATATRSTASSRSSTPTSTTASTAAGSPATRTRTSRRTAACSSASTGCPSGSRNQRYLVGDTITEADVRLFTTLARFDAVYHGHFKCNRTKLTEMPVLWAYARDLFQTPGLRRHDRLRAHQAPLLRGPPDINPTGIVPVGPDLTGWLTPHDREQLGGRPFGDGTPPGPPPPDRDRAGRPLGSAALTRRSAGVRTTAAGAAAARAWRPARRRSTDRR